MHRTYWAALLGLGPQLFTTALAADLTKALTITLKREYEYSTIGTPSMISHPNRDPDNDELNWIFFETDYGQAPDTCGEPLDFIDPTKAWKTTVRDETPFPHGAFGPLPLKVQGDECTYYANGKNPGKLVCGDFEAGCRTSEKDGGSAMPCGDGKEYEVHTVAVCEW